MSPTKAFATASRLVSKSLVLEHLTVRKNAIREFLNAVRSIREQPIDERVFEKCLHTKSGEPYFSETAYKASAPSEVTIVDRVNRSILMQKKVTIDKDNEVNLTDVAIAVD